MLHNKKHSDDKSLSTSAYEVLSINQMNRATVVPVSYQWFDQIIVQTWGMVTESSILLHYYKQNTVSWMGNQYKQYKDVIFAWIFQPQVVGHFKMKI